ncbi:hypothetical protein L0152_08040 [bacterium]|nr:hypothetical protein [bacterium]
MSGRFVAGLIVGAMIMGPYRITADEKKIDPCGLETKAEVEQVIGTLKEAFSTKRGTNTEVYVRKGETILEVDSSGGIDFAKPIAEKTFTRLK